METKFTKEKWEISDDNVCIIVLDSKTPGDIVCVAPKGYKESMKNWEANAKLIEAAPLLKDALIHMLELTNGFDWSSRSLEEYANAYANYSNLIQEATL